MKGRALNCNFQSIEGNFVRTADGLAFPAFGSVRDGGSILDDLRHNNEAIIMTPIYKNNQFLDEGRRSERTFVLPRLSCLAFRGFLFSEGSPGERRRQRAPTEMSFGVRRASEVLIERSAAFFKFAYIRPLDEWATSKCYEKKGKKKESKRKEKERSYEKR
jgi:hypothetical protein